MKKCPTCVRYFDDDAALLCQYCGTTLLHTQISPTAFADTSEVESSDNAITQEPQQAQALAVLSVSFKKLEISSELHRYALTATLRLTQPPAKNGFLLKLSWPKFIRITRDAGLIEAGRQQQGGIEYIEFTYEHRDKLWPGKTIDIVGRNDRVELEYEFDSSIWHLVDGNKITLNWSIYFSDDMPVEGQVDFDTLNVF